MAVDLSTITVQDFKDQFPRDFPYLPEYDNAALYNIGGRVYYSTTLLFYDCTVNGTTGVLPTDTNNWDQVSDSIDNYVQDSDIERAFLEAQANFNQSLFSSDAQIIQGYLYLTAHYLVMDLRNALSGLDSASSFPVNSRSVGSVSESYTVPDVYQNNPTYSYFAQSGYGLKYLSLIYIRTVGNVNVVCGSTTP